MTSNGVAIVNTWVRSSGNEHVTFNSDDMRPIANLARIHVLAAGFREYDKGKTIVSLSLAYNGLMVMVYTDIDKQSPPPFLALFPHTPR